MKILSFGEILFDMIDGVPHLGGAPLNFAAHLAQCRQESYIFSCVGADELGKLACSRIEGLGVKTTFIQIDGAHPTGTVRVTLRQGQPDYIIEENAAYDFISAGDKRRLLQTMEFDVLYFGSLAQRNPHSATTLQWLTSQQTFKHIFYDVNLRKNGYTKDIVQNSLRLCTIVKLNEEEVALLSGILHQRQDNLEDFLRYLTQEFMIEIVIVTAGEKGCYLYQQGIISSIKAYPVQVVDTIGAGDSFSAGFIYHYMQYKDPLQAARVANILGSFVAGCRGAIPAYSPEIRSMLGNKGISP